MSLEMLRDMLKPTWIFSISEGKLFFWLLISVAKSGISQIENYAIPIWSHLHDSQKDCRKLRFWVERSSCWLLDLYPPPHELWWFVGLAYYSRYHHFYHFLSTFSRIKVVRILQKLETTLSTWGQNLNLLSCSCHSIGGKCLRRSKKLLKFCFCVTFTGSTNTGPDLTQPCPAANLAKGGKKETMHLNSTSSAAAASSSSSAPWRHTKGWERIAFGLEEAASRPGSVEQVQTWIRIFDTCI